MYRKILLLSVITNLVIVANTQAQVAPSAPAIPGAPVAPAAPAPANLWSFLLPNADQKAACKTAFCNSPLGMMLNSAGGPISAMSGGLMGNRCLQNSIQQDLLKPADDPEGLAARVKSDEADAIERRKAVRFLGTVDCNRWPEAITALKNALRKDRNECVRFEAALALRNGCCCNNEIIDALKNSVLGEYKTDPNPVEKSDRVRAAAAEALALCPMVYEEPKKDQQQLVNAAPKLPTDPTEYYRKIAQIPREEMAASARAVLASLKKGGQPQQTTGTEVPAPIVAAPAPAIAPRNNSITSIFANAFTIPPPTVNGVRQPFFSNLTKSLTGHQEAASPIRQDPPATLPSLDIPVRDRPATPVPQPRPFSITNQIFDQPLENLQELKQTASMPKDPLPPIQNREATPQMTVQLAGPSEANLGMSVEYDVRIANRSNQPLSGLVLYISLPENLTHVAGREIKGLVHVNILPGEVKTLKVATVAVGVGQGQIRVKVVSSEGECRADSEIVCNVPTALQMRSAPQQTEIAPDRVGDGAMNSRKHEGLPPAPIANGINEPRGEAPVSPRQGAIGSTAVEAMLPADLVLPGTLPPRR